eukprot:SM000178S03460  [mRNA]  locus=s178:253086:254685:+ [translate_table: standard]
MFRNQYDTDVTTWSPAGRLHQIEYAMEAVKQGSCAVGLHSGGHAVLATLKRSASELSSYQARPSLPRSPPQPSPSPLRPLALSRRLTAAAGARCGWLLQRKIVKVDDHLGVAVAGLNADGRMLTLYMRNECISHKFVYESPLPVGRLVVQVADKSQVNTQRSWTRPYGVGLLVAGYDGTGPHLYQASHCCLRRARLLHVRPGAACSPHRMEVLQGCSNCHHFGKPTEFSGCGSGTHSMTCMCMRQTCPSGNYYEYHAMAIGSRSQAAKTYLERKFKEFSDCSLEQLIQHALTAEGELTTLNCSLAYVGKDTAFTIVEDAAMQPYLEALSAADEGGDGGGAANAAEPETQAAAAAADEGKPEEAAAPAEAGEAPDQPPAGDAEAASGERAPGRDEPTPMDET